MKTSTKLSGCLWFQSGRFGVVSNHEGLKGGKGEGLHENYVLLPATLIDGVSETMHADRKPFSPIELPLRLAVAANMHSRFSKSPMRKLRSPRNRMFD